MTLRLLVPKGTPLLRNHVVQMQRLLGVGNYDLTVRGVNNARIQRLNRQYRGLDEPTDVLAFPAHEGFPLGTLPPPNISGELELGELVFGLPYVADTCVQDCCDLDARIMVLLAHGLCHLLGHTHDEPGPRALMQREERRLLLSLRDPAGLLTTERLMAASFLPDKNVLLTPSPLSGVLRR